MGSRASRRAREAPAAAQQQSGKSAAAASGRAKGRAGSGGNGAARNELEPSNLSASGRKLLVQALDAEEEASAGGGGGEADSVVSVSDGDAGDETGDALLTKASTSSLSSSGSRQQTAPGDLKAQLLELQRRPENAICADCTAPSSTWASTTFGVFLCANCAGAHRSLGAHISFMQSITLDLDNWKPAWTTKLEEVGNLRANDLLEYYVPHNWPKPGDSDTPGAYLREYVKAKYEDQLFSREHNANKTHRLPPVPWEQRTTRLARAHASMGQGRIEYVGIVSVRVLRAEHLAPMSAAIPLAPAPSAFFTNPYCVVRLGEHEARTRAISRALNPEWNEGPQENVRFNMSWNGVALLEVSVWNHEKVGKDRIIGSALVDINQLKASAPHEDAAAPSTVRSVCVKLFEYRPQAASVENISSALFEMNAVGGSARSKSESASRAQAEDAAAPLDFGSEREARSHSSTHGSNEAPARDSPRGEASGRLPPSHQEQQYVSRRRRRWRPSKSAHRSSQGEMPPLTQSLERCDRDGAAKHDEGGAENVPESDEISAEGVKASIKKHGVAGLLPRDSSTEAVLRATSDSLRGSFDADTSSENDDLSADDTEANLGAKASAPATSSSDGSALVTAPASSSTLSSIGIPGLEADSLDSGTPDSSQGSSKVRRHRRKRSLTKLHLRDKMKDAVENLVNVLARNGSIDSEYYMEEENDELGRARRERGYFFVGKLNLELSFMDLR